MKKFRIITLSLLFLVASIFFVACKKDTKIFAEKIELSDENLVLQLGETVDVDVIISPQKVSSKKFEIVDGYDINVVGLRCDYKNMKIYVTARDFITAGLTETIIGVRTVDGSDKEAHLHIKITEDDQTVSTPQNLSFDGQNLTWQFVDMAEGYEISINDSIYILPSTVNKYYIDLFEYAGQTLVAKVKANGQSKNLDSDWTEEYEFTVLYAPKNLVYSDETKLLSWEEVENAAGYNVFVNDRPVYTETAYINLSNAFTQEGLYDIKVVAVGTQDGAYINSTFSNSTS